MDSIETPDDYTVVFKLNSPDAFMMDGFASPFNAIYSAKDIAKDPTTGIKRMLMEQVHTNLSSTLRVNPTSAVRYDDFHHGDNCLDRTVGYRIKGIG